MKILFTSENYFPNVSGVPVVVRYLAEGLCKRGHDVSIATQAVKNYPNHEKINNVDVFRFNIWKDWKHSYKGDKESYVNFIKQSNIDLLIIECSECVTTDTLIPFLKDIKSKIFFHAHGLSGFDNKFLSIKDNIIHTLGSTYNWFNSQLYFRYTFKKAFKYIDTFLCLSEVDSGIEYIKTNSKRWYVLDNAADNIFFDKSIAPGSISKYAILKNDKYLISCANYTVVKNQKDMIRQYFMSNSSKEYSLICIGSRDNEYYKECQNLVYTMEKKHGHRDVHLIIGVQRSDIPSIINGASLYLVTSRWEQYSISIIEAMSQGVPFISTNVGNSRLLPGGKTISSCSEMHNEIDKLLSDKINWSKYSKEGTDFAYKNCRIDAVLDKMESLINTNTNNDI